MGLQINESWVDATKGCRMGESGVYETHANTIRELFKIMAREYGRCTGKMFIDGKGGTQHIGWMFQKRKQYDDCEKTFILETWVSVHEQRDTVQTHYAKL